MKNRSNNSAEQVLKLDEINGFIECHNWTFTKCQVVQLLNYIIIFLEIFVVKWNQSPMTLLLPGKKVAGEKSHWQEGWLSSIVTVSDYINLLLNSVSYGHCTPHMRLWAKPATSRLFHKLHIKKSTSHYASFCNFILKNRNYFFLF